MASITEIQKEIVEEFGFFDGWTDKYEYLIDMGKALPLIDEKYKTEEHRIKGCQSQVWLNARSENGHVVFTADSDAIITKGLIAMLIRVISNQPGDEIAEAQLTFIDDIGLYEHLSPTRSNGLAHMIDRMKNYGRNFSQKENSSPEINSIPTSESISTNGSLMDRAQAAIQEVYDPEIPVNIYELGLIYELNINDAGIAKVRMTLTSPACPVAESLPMEVQEKLMSVEGIEDVDLQLVWDPPWSKDRMSDAARLELNMF